MGDMASLAPSPRVESPAVRPRPRPRPDGRPSRRSPAVARQRRMAGSVVWIGVVAVLLAGVVAVNVAVLRLNVRLDRLSHERAQLHADNAALQQRLASAGNSLEIEQLAQSRLGYVPADSAHTTYLSIAPK